MKYLKNNKHKNVLLNICTARDGRASLAGVRGHIQRVWPLFFGLIFQISRRSTSRARVLNDVCSEEVVNQTQSSTSRARVLNAGFGLRRSKLSIQGQTQSSTSRARVLNDVCSEEVVNQTQSSTSRARVLNAGFGSELMEPSLQSGLTSRARVLILTIVMVLTSSVLFGLSTTQSAHAAPSDTLNFQGRLLGIDGGLVADGYYNIEFNLYTAASGGSSIWTEAREYNSGSGSCTGPIDGNDCRVRVTNGYFSVYLGEVTALPNIDYSQQLYLTMNIDQNGTTSAGAITYDGEMNPRFKLTAVPYAFRAANVASGDTNTASTDTNDVNITTGDALGATSNSGDITIDNGTATGTAGQILLGTNNTSGITLGRSGATTTLQGSVSLTGTGTALTVTNNSVFNGNVTIGDATSDSLTVEANATFNGSLTVSTGDTFINSGATLNTAVAVADLPSGGAIGTAAATVDGATTFNISQTTAGQALTLPTPTNATAGRVVYINNVGSASFTMYGTTIGTSGSNAFIWNGTAWITTVSLSGSSVSVVGTLDSQTKSADGAVILGNAIYLQTADGSNPGLVNTGAQTFAGAKTFSSLVTGQSGLTVSGADVNINTSSNFNTNINTGTSTGAVNIGNSAAAAVNIQSSGNVVLTSGGVIGLHSNVIQTNQSFILKTSNGATRSTSISTGDTNGSSVNTGALNLTTGNATGATSDSGSINIDAGTATGTAGSVNIGTTNAIGVTLGSATNTVTVQNALTSTGLITANGGLTVETGDTFTFNGDAFTDLTGNGLQVASNALTLQVQANKGLEVDANGISLIDCGDGQILQYSTGTSSWACADVDTGSDEIITVAADDTPAAQKAAADYVADNVDDHLTINTAIASLGANGGVVQLLPGTFTVDGSIEITSNVTLAGSGQEATTIIAEAGAIAAQYDVIENANPGSTDNNITIRNLTIDGNRDNVTGFNVEGILFDTVGSGSGATYVRGFLIENVTVTGTAGNGIDIDTSANGIIENVIVKDFANASGIRLLDSSYIKVNNTDIADGVGTGLLFDGSDYNTITNNTIDDNGVDGIRFDSDARENLIQGNRISNNSGSGIDRNGGGPIQYNTISNNFIGYNDAEGIHLANAYHNIISDNYFYINDSSGTGVHLNLGGNGSNNSVTGNTFRESASDGSDSIWVSASQATTYIADNFIDNVGGVDNSSTTTIYANQMNSTDDLILQASGTADVLINSDTNITGTLQVSGLATFNGGLTVEAGDTFTFNTDAFTDFTGGGLYNNSGLLSVTNTGASGFFQNGGNLFGTTATLGTNDGNPLVLRTNSTTALTIDTSQNITTAGNLDVAGRGAFGNTATIGDSDATTNSVLAVENSITTITNDLDEIGTTSRLVVNPNTNPAALTRFIGSDSEVEIDAANTTDAANTYYMGSRSFAYGQGTGDLGQLSGVTGGVINISSGNNVNSIEAGGFVAFNGTSTVGQIIGILGGASNSGNVTEAFGGKFGYEHSGGTGTTTTAYGGEFELGVVDAGSTISTGYGLSVDVGTASGGTITDGAGIAIDEVDATDATNLLIGTLTIPNGADYSIYNASTRANYFAGNLTLNQALQVNGNTTLGDASGDTLTVNAGSIQFANNFVSCNVINTDASGNLGCNTGSFLTNSLTDNITDAFDLQEGTNNYININTTNGSENISFGNATTNPSYNFLGSGTLAVAGAQTIGGNLTVDTNTFFVDATNNRVAVGTTTTTNSVFTVLGTAPDVLLGSTASISSTLAGVTSNNSQSGLLVAALADPSGAVTNGNYTGATVSVSGTSANLSSDDSLTGLSGLAFYGGTGTIGELTGGVFGTVLSSGTVIDSRGIEVLVDNSGGTLTSGAGVVVNNLTGATNNTNIAILNNSATLPTGNWNIYSDSTYNSALAGNLRIGSTTAPTVALDVTGSGAFSGNLDVAGALTVTGLTTLNGGLTIETGDTFTFNGDAFTDLTGSGLVLSSNALTVDATSATGFFRNGGNDFGGNAVLGTNTAGQTLEFETANTTRFTVSSTASTLTGNGATSILGGSSLNLGSTGANTVTLATNATTRFTVANNASTLTGNGATSLVGGSTLTLNAAAASALNLGTTQTSGAITIGGTGAATGAINLGTGTGAQAINLGTGGTAAKTVTVGSTASTSTTTIQSGTGGIALQGNTTINGTIANSAQATLTAITGSYSGSSDQASGLRVSTTFNPASSANIDVAGIISAPVNSNGNLNGGDATLIGVVGTPAFTGAGSIDGLIGIAGATVNAGGGTVGVAMGAQFLNAVNTGTITRNVGVNIDNQTSGSNNTNLFIGGTTAPLGNYSIYNSSAYNNYFAGALEVDGLVELNGGLTIEAGDTFTFNGDAFTDFTGGGLVNTGGVLSVDTTSATGFFQNGGNSFSGTATLGTNNGNSLVLETNNQSALTIASGGAATFQNASNSTSGFRINNAAGSSLLTADTTNFLLKVAPTQFISSGSTQNFGSSGSITGVDSYSTIAVNATAPSTIITLPAPAVGGQVVGRVVYVTAVNGSNDFTLRLGGTLIDIAMKANSTATLIWNGTGWTAAGASSSTDLQSAYNNTLTSAGGAEIVLNPSGGAADGFTIRNNETTPINGGILEVQSSIGTNLFSVNNLAAEYAANGGAEESTTFSTNWSSIGTSATITRNTTGANLTTGQGSVQVTTTGGGSNKGVRNNLATPLATNTSYQVSFTAKLASGTFTTLEVVYSRNGGTNTVPCTNVSGTTLVTTGFTKITCTITTDGTAPSNADLIIRQTDTTNRTFYIDNLSVVENSATSVPDNVQIGGGINGGPVTLFTLDRSSAPPVANGNETYLGSMYYDTTSGRIQCYEADGWGACGSAPNNYVNLTPEYPGSVLNGTGVGTMTADFCANESGVLQVNTSFCASGESKNYYNWTSPQATQQVYSIYITYQLPAAFKAFESNDSVQLTARTDNTTNGVVTYEMFRNEGGAITACGTETTVTTSADTWQTVGINGDEADGCGFSSTSADNFVIFKINMKASNNANVYSSTLSFTTIGQ